MSNTDILYTFDTYITEGIENYWQNGLFVVPKLGQDTVLVPHIIWGPIPNFQADGYKIYWSLNTQGGPPGNFSLLAILGANTYEYTHEGLAANGNWKAYYKVKAYNSTSESGFTNTAEIGVGGFFKDKGYAYTDNNNKFTLLSNFPNPFNPVTNIKFHLPASSFADRQAGIPKTNHVTLKVFDLLGREVAILINEPKQVGEYEIEFNASKYGLTSGVYLYQLRCYDFLQTKKFILMK
ncbi:MAG: T9SS type A sorting domain-containing protein [Bacteroidetes bacterium]|nr:T9SS type A sorting domain-containing protein [Bacteroidota bacterium]